MTSSLSTASSLVAIFGNNRQDTFVPAICALLEGLSGAGFRLAVESAFFDYMASHGVAFPAGTARADALPGNARVLLSIGGDGTFLSAVCWAKGRDVALLGVNTGHLGYLAPYSIADIDGITGAIAGKGARIESRRMLRLRAEGMPDGLWPYALNEVAVAKEETGSTINVRAWLDDIFLADYRADGLVISTPTGSTGYNLSAGGPLLQPELNVLVLSPIAPHSLTLRPLVVSARSDIKLSVESRAGSYRVSLDGRSFTLPCSSRIEICESEFAASVVMPAGESFVSLLRSKLYWGRG